MSSCGSIPCMESSAPSSITAGSTPTHTFSQTLEQRIHILRFCLVDWFPSYCSQLEWGQGCLAATNLEVHAGDHDILDYCTFRTVGSEWCTECHIRQSLRKRSWSAESIKVSKWFTTARLTQYPRREVLLQCGKKTSVSDGINP